MNSVKVPRDIHPAIAELEKVPLIRALMLVRGMQMLLDGVVTGFSFVLAHVLRLDGWPTGIDSQRMLLLLPYVVIGRVVINRVTGIYRRVWRYTGLSDALYLAATTGIVSIVLMALRIGFPYYPSYLAVPIGIIVIEYFGSTVGMSSIRVFRRLMYEHAKRLDTSAASSIRTVLLAGAGDAGIMTLREISARRDLGMHVCGFVDDDEKKIGSIIRGVSVLGKISDLPDLIATYRVDQVIITMASAPRKTLRRILDSCQLLNVHVKIVPGLYEIIGERVSVSRLRPVQIEDLLGRDTIDINAWLADTKPYYVGKRVMVTGGGGSIGRELCRQVASLSPASIIMVDKDENGVFESDRDLSALAERYNVKVHSVVCDVKSEHRLTQIFDRYRPHIVFHAAAHKHVPLMEQNASEAVLNNIVGTLELLRSCSRYEVERCVMVSTDKAVNPSSIMGATKRVAELMFQAQALKLKGRGHYSCVRFGNVLASRGSVVPIFRQQISNGGPVTVTHPEMTRYFMTIPEAAQLIIQAGALGSLGEIFLLDMGEPVKVIDLARDMIRLSGLTSADIDIKIIGLRSGEKLKEELTISEEGAKATRFEKIYSAPPIKYDFDGLSTWIERLRFLAVSGDDEAIAQVFEQMGIGFHRSETPRLAENKAFRSSVPGG